MLLEIFLKYFHYNLQVNPVKRIFSLFYYNTYYRLVLYNLYVHDVYVHAKIPIAKYETSR